MSEHSSAEPATLERTGPFTPEEERVLLAWRGRYPHPAMGLIEALREVQAWRRRIPWEAEERLAELFGVPVKAVHEVATFYPHFTLEPCGRWRISVCRNLSCSLAGAGKAVAELESRLGVRCGQTTPDGEFSLETVECLGQCDAAPAVAVNDEALSREACRSLKDLPDRLSKEGLRGVAPEPAFVWSPGSGEDRRLLTRHFHLPDLHRLDVYRSLGGYEQLRRALAMTPAATLAEVQKSNLRGLGGAGFPTGFKWSTVPARERSPKPRYLVVNADESEPGCFKDRVLLERSPHLLIEGTLIAARAIEADGIFIFLRGEYLQQHRVLAAALAEAREAGILGPSVLGSGFAADILVMRGANAYITGADTALLETMEGKKAWPRQPPPFPTSAGLFGCPTVVNNVETLCMVPHILRLGGEGFAARGHGKSGGTAVYSVSGHVARPGVYEFPMGTPLSDILAAAGGVPGGRGLKAVIPGGTSTPVLTAAEVHVRMDFDSLKTVGSFLGAGGIVVLDESADMVEVLHVIERFLWHESCGQCTPCREGSGWMTRALARVLAGGGVAADLPNLARVGENITGKVICALGDTVGTAAKAMLQKFPGDFEARVK